MWGVFEEEDSVHIVPINDDLRIRPPHILDDFCPCCPEVPFIGDNGRLVISHNEIH